MPTNLPPEYYKVELRYRDAETTAEKIALLEEMMGIVPKHKGTDKLRADLRRRLSRLRDAAQAQKKAGRHVSQYHVEKEGAGRVVITGPPNSGKSALLAALTHAEPKISAAPYSTWTPLPGMMPFEDILIQLIDTPPLSREHIEPELPGLIRSAELLLLVVDLLRDPIAQLRETADILMAHKIVPRCGKMTAPPGEPLTVLPALVAVNKNDQKDLDEDFRIFCELLEDEWPLVAVSALTGRNLDQLKQAVYRELEIIRIYSKPPGKDPVYESPFVLKKGGTVEQFAEKVHRDFLEDLKTARVWGRDVFDGQPVSRDHVLHEGDVVELHT